MTHKKQKINPTMANKKWTVELQNRQHIVELRHNIISGKRRISVDDHVVEEGANFLDLGGDYPLRLGNEKGSLHIRLSPLAFSYDLSVAGKSIETGKPVTEIQQTPDWLVLFMTVYTVVILGISAHNVLLSVPTGAVAGFCAAASLAISKNGSLKTFVRFLLCAVFTVLFAAATMFIR